MNSSWGHRGGCVEGTGSSSASTLDTGPCCDLCRSRAVPQRPPPHRHPHTAQARQALRVNTGFSFPYNTISAKSQLPTSCLWIFENSDILSLGRILASVQRLIFLVEESLYGGGYVAMLPTGHHRWVERGPPTRHFNSSQQLQRSSLLLSPDWILLGRLSPLFSTFLAVSAYSLCNPPPFISTRLSLNSAKKTEHTYN